MNNNELYHYGIKGMKWGIRRYQNYDGSYTKKGLERYNKAKDKFIEAERNRKEAKKVLRTNRSQKNKDNYRTAKSEAKRRRDEANRAYDKLKTDKLADQGKELYRKGKTISGNNLTSARVQTAIVIGSGVVNRYISYKTGDVRLANASSAAIAIGGTAVNAILSGKSAYQNKRLRAYYAH